MEMQPPLRVLFLCTGNSARSQVGEALLRHMSRGQVEVFSAGSQPRPKIHPMARRAVKDLFGTWRVSAPNRWSSSGATGSTT